MDEKPLGDLPEIAVRTFIPSDAEGIVSLIRRNYGDTYHKTFFYEPDSIRRTNEMRHIISIVAHYYETIIGHFALIPSPRSAVAEIGVAVVDPSFKHLGVMNRMFDLLTACAQEIGLKALYGEAIMLHPFSQKANLHHGMSETAVLLGEVPSNIEIEHRLKDAKRSGAMVAYLLFERGKRTLNLPRYYRPLIAATYDRAGVPFSEKVPSVPSIRALPEYRYNAMLGIGFIVIDAPPMPEEIERILQLLSSQNCDMLYADINLHRIAAIDRTVSLLNRCGFFYAGVMFACYADEDYLRMQRKNTQAVDEEHLVCHSDFAKDLLAFILEDERRIQ